MQCNIEVILDRVTHAFELIIKTYQKEYVINLKLIIVLIIHLNKKGLVEYLFGYTMRYI